MTDTLTWTAPVSTSFTPGTGQAMLDALATLVTADAHWSVSASNTADGWLEIAPVAGPYVNDRYVFSVGYVTVLGSMLKGAAAVVATLMVAGSPDRGAGGPTWPSGRTGDPYTGGTWTKFVEFTQTGYGCDGLTICTSRDGLVIAYHEPSGDTHIALLGRLVERPNGDDVVLVSGIGTVAGGVLAAWQGSSGTGSSTGTPIPSLPTATTGTGNRIGAATAAESAIDLSRINQCETVYGSWSTEESTFVAIPIALGRLSNDQLFGVMRQVKLGGRQAAASGSITQSAVVVAMFMGANQLNAEDVILLTQSK